MRTFVLVRRLVLIFLTGFVLLSLMPSPAHAGHTACFCCPARTSCTNACSRAFDNTRRHITQEFVEHRELIIKIFWEQHILPALMRMTQQLTAVAMQQTMIMGTIMDAKHQLETQALFQELQAQAHIDYHPSEGLCQFGTNTRSLAASEQNVTLSMLAISARTMQRQLRTGDTVSVESDASDKVSRLEQFKEVYCNPNDNGNALEPLCQAGGTKERRNKDVDFTRTLGNPLTLKMDFTNEGDGDHAGGMASPDEEDVFALSANLYSSAAPSAIPNLSDGEMGTAFKLMDYRALAAKRAVAQNSFAAIAAEKSQGAPEVAQYLKEILKGLEIPEEEINQLIGERPSYFAQMEILTKKIYQNPSFYTELYDKPANVERKRVALQAIDLMQKRDIYRSLLRSEASLSVLLETELIKEQDRIVNEDIQ